MRTLALAIVPLIWAANVALAGPAVLAGAVATPLTLDRPTLEALPAKTIEITFETSKGTETATYTGVLLWDLVEKAGLVNAGGKNAELRHTLMVSGADGYTVAVALGEFSPRFGAKDILVAFDGGEGKASFEHLRLLVPGDRHGGRAVSDLASITVE